MDARSTSAAADLQNGITNSEGGAVGAHGQGGEVVPFAPEVLCFRAYRLLPYARILLHHGEPVDIGGRAFDLLDILLRSRGAVVERADIFRHVWPTTTVDDSNLRFQVSCLRKALGNDRELVKTVPGRGYMLAADIAAVGQPAPSRLKGAINLTSAVDALQDNDVTYEILRSLLRSALDELWAMTRDGDRTAALSDVPARIG